jgi:hypothetical protein
LFFVSSNRITPARRITFELLLATFVRGQKTAIDKSGADNDIEIKTTKK